MIAAHCVLKLMLHSNKKTYDERKRGCKVCITVFLECSFSSMPESL